jgi:hypothetical protein
MKTLNSISSIWRGVFPLLFLSGCGPDIEKKEVKIVLITDHEIGEGKGPNSDLKALLAPIEPGTSHTFGFIPEVTILRSDIGNDNIEVLDLSNFRSNISFLPQNDFDYAAGLRRNALSEITEPFQIEKKQSEGLRTNIDSLIKANYPESLVIQYANKKEDNIANFNQIDSLVKFIRQQLYSDGFDPGKIIVINYKTKQTVAPTQVKVSSTLQNIELENAAFMDCHTLTWPNNVPGINYKVTWPNFSQNLGNVGLFQIPHQYRNKKLNVTLCAYANGYDSVVKCAQMPYKPCPPATAGVPRTVNTPIAAEEPIGDMGLRIANGVIVWNQKPGYVYRFKFSRGGKFDAEAALGPIQYTNYEGPVFLARNDVKIRDYIKNDIPYIFTLTAYKINPGTNKENLVSCYMLPAVTFRTVGQNSGLGFVDAECERMRLKNVKCNSWY